MGMYRKKNYKKTKSVPILNLVKIRRDPLICSVNAPSQWRYVKMPEENNLISYK
jgi:hypothetical protein